MPSIYEQLWSGEWFDYVKGMDIACCHCGLVHRLTIDFERKRVRLEERARATAQLRRHHKHECVCKKSRRKGTQSTVDAAESKRR